MLDNLAIFDWQLLLPDDETHISVFLAASTAEHQEMQ